MDTTIYRTVKNATYTPSAQRTDDADYILGDLTYVTFEECDHVALGNPAMSFKPGSKMICRTCTKAAA